MCGIAGILTASSQNITTQHLKKMTDALAHRGPDGEGFWNNKKESVFLGHRRLSIIDLSDKAAQPLHYLNRYTIVYNGEIYNYIEIRKSLESNGYRFKTQSDTEVIVAAYDLWKQKCLQQFDGMFAFAIWDEKDQQLFAARDRFGEKPFFYCEDEQHFIFASEMKALWEIGIEKSVDKKMLLNYLTLGYVQNSLDKEQTFYSDIFSLPPAHYLLFNLTEFKYKVSRYWNIDKEARIEIAPADAIEKFTALLETSVKRRLRSDVTVGTSLSGGLDSSSILMEMINFSSPGFKPKTFSAVFPSFEKDESKYIKLITEQFNIENFQTQPSIDGFIKDFEKICYHQEEPFGSASIYAQYKVFELAKQHDIKVLLDGQGADETLAGYTKYIHWFLQEVLSRHKLGFTRKERLALVKNQQPFHWGIKNYFAAFFPSHASIQLEKREYFRTVSHPDISKDFLTILKGHEWEGIHKPIITKLNDVLHFNITEMGLEELLRFADRNSMAHGREVRLPFLNHELMEFVFSLPSSYKIHEGWTKWLLRKAMDKKLPNEITWRKDKVGYEPPQKQWMQDKNFEEYIFEAKRILVNENVLAPKVLDKKIQAKGAHSEDNFDWRYLCAAQFI